MKLGILKMSEYYQNRKVQDFQDADTLKELLFFFFLLDNPLKFIS